MADTLSFQFDGTESNTIVNAIVHNLVDVDLEDLSRQQGPIEEEPASSLRLDEARFAGVQRSVVCDTS